MTLWPKMLRERLSRGVAILLSFAARISGEGLLKACNQNKLKSAT